MFGRHDRSVENVDPEPIRLAGAMIVPDHSTQTAILVGIAQPPGKLTRTGPLIEIDYETGIALTVDGMWRLQ